MVPTVPAEPKMPWAVDDRPSGAAGGDDGEQRRPRGMRSPLDSTSTIGTNQRGSGAIHV